mmetsp:Transcript_14166/g.41563  ORF Transcript_14166/g.41563 Transcript_14166/m.41563 type:complete len:124 (-) Transcript_14166:46-417(-)
MRRFSPKSFGFFVGSDRSRWRLAVPKEDLPSFDPCLIQNAGLQRTSASFVQHNSVSATQHLQFPFSLVLSAGQHLLESGKESKLSTTSKLMVKDDSGSFNKSSLLLFNTTTLGSIVAISTWRS